MRICPILPAAFLVLLPASVLISIAPAFAGRENRITRPLDACALLTSRDIQTVQGEAISDMKSSRPERSLFAVSQCFYTLPTFSRSISLEVTRKDPSRPDAESPRAHFMKLFREGAPSAGSSGDAGEEPGAPVPVEGIGDEAFWSGDGVVGALYVLKEDAYLRLSIGGPEDAAVKIEKSKALAGKALKRL